MGGSWLSSLLVRAWYILTNLKITLLEYGLSREGFAKARSSRRHHYQPFGTYQLLPLGIDNIFLFIFFAPHNPFFVQLISCLPETITNAFFCPSKKTNQTRRGGSGS